MNRRHIRGWRPMAEQSIARLGDRPDALETIVRWIDQEWGTFSGRTPDETRARFAQEFKLPGLPTSVVAFDGPVAIGVATLRERDSVDWDPQVTPWICNVYVCAEARGKGIAGKLCRALEAVAQQLGYASVYLATRLAADSLYERLGYVRYRTYRQRDAQMYLMRRGLV